jgi:hypothetical protein
VADAHRAFRRRAIAVRLREKARRSARRDDDLFLDSWIGRRSIDDD